MKPTFSFFAAVVIAIAVGCETTQSTTGESAAALDPEHSVTMIVHGMGCPLCANNVDKQLLSVRGVENVSIDMGSGRVVVQHVADQKPTREELAKAIDDSGFTLVRFADQ